MVQDVWDVYREELGVVLEDVVLAALRDAASRSSVDDFLSIWSSNAEAGLFRAYSLAGGPTDAGSSAFLGRGLLRFRGRSQGDEVDVYCAQHFVNSSLAPVLLFRRRLKICGGCAQKVLEIRIFLSLGGVLF